jgi:WD40 repeat protein
MRTNSIDAASGAWFNGSCRFRIFLHIVLFVRGESMACFLPSRWKTGVCVSLALLALPLWHLVPPEPRVVIDGIHYITWLSPDGSTVCTVHRSGTEWVGPIRFWDTRTGEKTAGFLTSNEHSGSWPAFSPDGRRFVVSTGPDRLVFGDWQAGRSWEIKLPEVMGRHGYYLSSPDGEILAVLEAVGNIALVETATGRVLDRLDSEEPGGGPTWEFTRNGDYLAYGYSDKTASYVRLWNTRTRRREAVPDIDGSFAAISPDGKTLVTVHQEPKPDAEPINIATLRELDPPRQETRARFATKASYPVYSFADNSKILATWDGSGLESSTAEFWNVQTGQLIVAVTPETGECQSVVLSPDGSRFAVSLSVATGTKRNRVDHGKLTMHEVASGAELWTRTWIGESHGCRPRFNAGATLMQVYVQGHVEFLDAATGRTVGKSQFRKQPSGGAMWTTDSLWVTPDRRLLPYREEMQRVSFEPTRLEQFLAFLHIPNRPDEERSWDMVAILDMETGREIMHLEGTGTTNPAYLSDDGRTLVTEHADHIAVWDVPARPPLRWVLGAPAGLMLAAFVAARCLRFRRKPSEPKA